MSKSKIHTVILHPQYAKENWPWLQRFVYQNQENTIHVFSCGVVQGSQNGMLEFHGVMMKKSNDEKEDILLPLHAVVGVFLDQSRKNPLGFLNQEECNEQ